LVVRRLVVRGMVVWGMVGVPNKSMANFRETIPLTVETNARMPENYKFTMDQYVLYECQEKRRKSRY
jgi:hypothetical protein